MLWFADTSWEDPDLYRFLADLESYWEIDIHKHVDGRNPLQVAEQKKIIPNQRHAPCTLELKILPFVKYLKAMPKPVTVALGMDWKETHRMERPKAEYEKMEGVTVDFPLMWEPYETRPYAQVVASWGIPIPSLYLEGFPHNNCGGRCVKQGVAEWKRLKIHRPKDFAMVRDWERDQRGKGGARANYAIARDQSGGEVKPKTMAEIEREAEPQDGQLPLAIDDAINCFCSY